MVPGSPTSVLVCRYTGLNPASRAFRLIAHRVIRRGTRLRRLARQLDALKPQKGPQNCPGDDGSAIIAVFRYSHTRPDPVTIGLAGCRLVTNGYRHREATSRIIDELEG